MRHNKLTKILYYTVDALRLDCYKASRFANPLGGTCVVYYPNPTPPNRAPARLSRRARPLGVRENSGTRDHDDAPPDADRNVEGKEVEILRNSGSRHGAEGRRFSRADPSGEN
jgi:hypothetical protein